MVTDRGRAAEIRDVMVTDRGRATEIRDVMVTDRERGTGQSIDFIRYGPAEAREVYSGGIPTTKRADGLAGQVSQSCAGYPRTAMGLITSYVIVVGAQGL
ncbi:hypothetical protein ElyMa_000719100 [Elysia marginata]|uniref:Uncharacterized protein n=1 Tax=Elysia marginata TaxID=1093978 RepID=A0AAV4GM40_9GAST|nr:hypothetical protein ElyMa_000719100 [Elysia marginata]